MKKNTKPALLAPTKLGRLCFSIAAKSATAALLMAIFILTACPNGDDTNNTGNKETGLSAQSAAFNSYNIEVYFDGKFAENLEDKKAAGFTAALNGTSMPIVVVYSGGNYNYITIHVGDPYWNTFEKTDNITVSFDGTSGDYAGKIKAFNLTAVWDSTLN